MHTADVDNISEISASAANVTNDGKHPLLEFALRYFRDVQLLMEGASSSEGGGGKKGKKNKKDKKGGVGSDAGNSEGDWRWKNQLDMVKWTDRMINVSIMTSFNWFIIFITYFLLILINISNQLTEHINIFFRIPCWD